VLDIALQDIAVHPPGTPLQPVLRAWPAYLEYVVSFLTIGAAWLAHTALTDRLARSDPIFWRSEGSRAVFGRLFHLGESGR